MKTPKLFKCIKLMPNQPAEVCTLSDELQALQDAVSDHGEPSLIEFSYPFADDAHNFIMGNEEAKLINMTPNRIINGELYCGPIYIIREGYRGELVSITKDDEKKYLEKFSDPTPPSDEEIENHLSRLYSFYW